MGDVIEFPRRAQLAPSRPEVNRLSDLYGFRFSCTESCALQRLYDPAFRCACEQRDPPPSVA